MGRLAIITSASLRVVSRPAAKVVLAAETDRPSVALRGVIRLLREGPLPHLVELNGRPDGRVSVLLSLWGAEVTVADAAARVASTLGLPLADLPALPPPVMFDASATRMRAALPSVVRVLERWEASSPKRPIRIDRFTTHSAQIACPDAGPCAAGLERAPELGRPTQQQNQDYLQRLKAALDVHNLLGSL
jgi:FAD/FMN-containing dehydrogenase